jgi:hypothetical protein
MMRFLRFTAIAVAVFAVLESARAAPFELRLGLSAIAGLDRPLRGGGAELEAGFRDDPFLPGLGIGLTGDTSLGGWLLEMAGSVGLGPGLHIRGGAVLPLGGLAADLGDGRSLALEVPPPPSFFGLDARLGVLELGESRVGEARLRLETRLRFDWFVWYPGPAKDGGTTVGWLREDALAAFSLGFRLGIGAAIAWAPWLPERAAAQEP